jgi:hypothetical protein
MLYVIMSNFFRLFIYKFNIRHDFFGKALINVFRNLFILFQFNIKCIILIFQDIVILNDYLIIIY